MTLNTEPVAIANSVAAFVETILVALIAFGFELSGEQVAGITAVIIAGGQTAATIFARRRAFSPSTVEEVAANVAAGRDAGLLDH